MGNKNVQLDLNSVACSTLSKHRGGIQMIGSELNRTCGKWGKTRGDWHDSEGTSFSSSPFAVLPPLVNFTCTLLSECLEQAMNSDAVRFTTHE